MRYHAPVVRRFLAGVVVAVGVLPAFAQVVPSPDFITVGFLREDSVIIPFARFDGKQWRHGWRYPDGAGQSIVAPRLNRVPRAWWAGGNPVVEWELTKSSGERQQLRVIDSVTYETNYGTNVGLKSNYVTPLTADASQYASPLWEFAGVVASHPGVLRPVQEISRGDPEFELIRQLLPRMFSSVEAKVWSKDAAWVRAQTAAPELIAAHGALLPDGRRLIAFRARHQVTALGVTFLRSWVSRRDRSTFDTLRLAANQSDGDGKGEANLNPLAWLQIGDRVFWICSEFFYEGSGAAIIEVAGGRPRRLLDMPIG
jgi:hypothetical protein